MKKHIIRDAEITKSKWTLVDLLIFRLFETSTG
jgi:hypothetical protein